MTTRARHRLPSIALALCAVASGVVVASPVASAQDAGVQVFVSSRGAPVYTPEGDTEASMVASWTITVRNPTDAPMNDVALRTTYTIRDEIVPSPPEIAMMGSDTVRHLDSPLAPGESRDIQVSLPVSARLLSRYFWSNFNFSLAPNLTSQLGLMVTANTDGTDPARRDPASIQDNDSAVTDTDSADAALSPEIHIKDILDPNKIDVAMDGKSRRIFPGDPISFQVAGSPILGKGATMKKDVYLLSSNSHGAMKVDLAGIDPSSVKISNIFSKSPNDQAEYPMPDDYLVIEPDGTVALGPNEDFSHLVGAERVYALTNMIVENSIRFTVSGVANARDTSATVGVSNAYFPLDKSAPIQVNDTLASDTDSRDRIASLPHLSVKDAIVKTGEKIDPIVIPGDPASTVTVTGLPDGLSYDSATRSITGTTEKVGTHHVTATVSDPDADVIDFSIVVSEESTSDPSATETSDEPAPSDTSETNTSQTSEDTSPTSEDTNATTSTETSTSPASSGTSGTSKRPSTSVPTSASSQASGAPQSTTDSRQEPTVDTGGDVKTSWISKIMSLFR